MDVALQRECITGREARTLASPHPMCPLMHSTCWHREEGILCHYTSDLKGAQKLRVVHECCCHTHLCMSHLRRVALSDVEALGLVADKMSPPERGVSDRGN